MECRIIINASNWSIDTNLQQSITYGLYFTWYIVFYLQTTTYGMQNVVYNFFDVIIFSYYSSLFSWNVNVEEEEKSVIVPSYQYQFANYPSAIVLNKMISLASWLYNFNLDGTYTTTYEIFFVLFLEYYFNGIIFDRYIIAIVICCCWICWRWLNNIYINYYYCYDYYYYRRVC